MEKKLTTVANILIIIVAVAIGVQFLRGKLSVAGADGHLNPVSLEGKKFPIDEIWHPYKKTVVLALQVGCHYCTASAPFYDRITKFASQRGINVIAMLPNGQSESRNYLGGLKLKIDNIQQIDLGHIAVSGTPTVFVVNDKGVVEKVWEGQLEDDQEKKILALLG
jgi:hypothetical protein